MEKNMQQERRRTLRTRVARPAKFVVGGRYDISFIDCTVFDITNLGACLQLDGTLPSQSNELALSFDAARTLRPCRVVWQTRARLGVEFLTTQGKVHPISQTSLRIRFIDPSQSLLPE
jgi:hypothetical protein